MGGEGKGAGRSREKGNHNQDLVYEKKNPFSIKEKKKQKVAKTVWNIYVFSVV